jgi:hypothetical protein
MKTQSKPIHLFIGLCLLLLLGSASHAVPGDLDALDLNLADRNVLTTALPPDAMNSLTCLFAACEVATSYPR